MEEETELTMTFKKKNRKNPMSLAVFHFACVICNLSPVTCHLSPEHHSVQLELLESPRMFGNAAARGLLIDNKNNNDKNNNH